MADFEVAFAPLFDRAYRVAFRILGVRSDAEEMAQEALARAYERWPRLIRAGRPDAWVARVSSNLAIDRWRARQRILADAPDRAGVDPSATDRVALVRALRTLSHRQREVVVLRYLADMPEADVAASLGCSTGTVKQHASRGLARLRAQLVPGGDT